MLIQNENEIQSISTITMEATKIHNLNNLTASQTCLIMLRCLHSSDLAFMYMLYKPETLRNIEEECSQILAIDIEHREADSGLSPKEITEYNEYCMSLRKYADKYPHGA